MVDSFTLNQLVIGLSSEHRYKEVTYAHAHFRAQLLYASTGTIQVYANHQVWIMPPMCALWIPARVEHSVISLSHVKLNTALIEEDNSQSSTQTCFLIRVSALLHELLIRLNRNEDLTQSISQESLSLNHALQTLILDEIRQAHTLPIQIPWPADKRLSTICKKLLHTPNQLKDLNHWADSIGTSTRTLMRLFQKETGLSYRAWMQQMHIALSLDQISNGIPIAIIAENLGYTNASAFTAMFKRHLGFSPQHFKNRMFRLANSKDEL